MIFVKFLVLIFLIYSPSQHTMVGVCVSGVVSGKWCLTVGAGARTQI